MKPISIEVEEKDGEIYGAISINYNGRFDGIQINTYILGSSELVEFVAFDDKSISMPTRLYIHRNDIRDNHVKFRALVNGKGKKIRFRAAIIQEHKEIESDTKFLEIKG